jgi:hypothetical protein
MAVAEVKVAEVKSAIMARLAHRAITTTIQGLIWTSRH